MDFQANTELFDAINSLKEELASFGKNGASSSLENGMRGLNGLTDGWAYLLEHLELVKSKYGSLLTSQQYERLAKIQSEVHRIVYRA